MREVPQKPRTFGQRLDDAIAAIAPRWGMRRRQFRAAGEILARFSHFRGAGRDRLRSDWLPGGGSADSDLLPDLPDLRERSRDLIDSDPHAAGLLRTHADNVIGTGIWPQSRIDAKASGLSDEQIADLQRQCESAWWIWGEFADATGRLDVTQLQELIDSQLFANGEVFLLRRMIERPWKRFAFCWQVIEADRVDSPPGTAANKFIRSGIRINADGEPVEYYIRRTHPGDSSLGLTAAAYSDFDTIPARDEMGRPNVLHLYHTRRPDQSRGMPFMAPALAVFRDMAQYLEAEVVAARVAACFSAFIKMSDPLAAGGPGGSRETQASGQIHESLEPGMIQRLGVNEDIIFANPSRPGTNFDPFLTRMLRAIGVSLGIPYELVAKDFSRTNYSSARASLLEGWRYFTGRRDFITRKFCQPTYQLVLEEAYLRGLVDVPEFYVGGKPQVIWLNARWIGAKRGWIDPVKEIQASRDAMTAGISTLADEAAAQGGDWEENLEQIARERAKREELGIPHPDGAASASTQADPPDDQSDDSDNGDDDNGQSDE